MKIRTFATDGSSIREDIHDKMTDSYAVNSSGTSISFTCPRDVVIHAWSSCTFSTHVSLDYPNESSLSISIEKSQLPDGLVMTENDSMFSMRRGIAFTITNNSWIPQSLAKGMLLMTATEMLDAHPMSPIILQPMSLNDGGTIANEPSKDLVAA